MDHTQTWTLLPGIARRRWRIFLAVFLTIAAGALAVARFLPPVYRSSARILVEEQQIPQEFVKATITSYVEQRLQAITQQVMSRATLLEIVNRFRLYPELRERYGVEEVIAKMRRAIELKTISADVVDRKTGRPTAATVAFSVSFQGRDPVLVQKVADTLASLYLKENLKSREERASNTTAFLQQELETVRAETESLDGRISSFKRAHAGQLPEYDALNMQASERLDRAIDHLEEQVRSLSERKLYLEGQLAAVDPLGGDSERGSADPRRRLRDLRWKLSSLRSSVSDDHPDVKLLRKEIAELEAQVGAPPDDAAFKARELASLQERLASRRAELGPRHPDVVALARTAEALAREVASAKPAPEEQPVNPAYIGLKTQLAAVDFELQALRQERRKAEERRLALEARMAKAPLAEGEYARLTRDRETAQRRYEELMAKLMEARVAQGMEESQQGERFAIIEPAAFPETPEKPNRLHILLVGLALALGAGVGAAGAREALDPSVKHPGELQGLTEAPVLCALPFIQAEEEVQARRRRRFVWSAAGAACAVGAVLFVHAYWVPLDLVLFKVQRTFGG